MLKIHHYKTRLSGDSDFVAQQERKWFIQLRYILTHEALFTSAGAILRPALTTVCND